MSDLTETERALVAKAGDHHPETCDCSVYAEDGGYPEYDICAGLDETFAAVESILTEREAALIGRVEAVLAAFDRRGSVATHLVRAALAPDGAGRES